MSRRPRLVYIVTLPITANVLLRGQLTFLRQSGFDITVISSPGPALDRVAEREGVDVIAIPMAREISPAFDGVTLRHLIPLLRNLQPDIVNASTAKGSLLGMIAAAAVGVPIRVYLQRGLRHETERGIKRRLLTLAERTTTACAHHVICVSGSVRDVSIQSGFGPAEKYSVLGAGSSNGIDIARFSRSAERVREANDLRRLLAIPADAPVIGFVGRPVADKGLSELLEAFHLVAADVPGVRLVLIGAGIGGYDMDPGIARRIQHEHIVSVGAVDEVAPFYAMMDVLAFPSHREGMPNAPLEAAACEVPTVGARATGVGDAIVSGTTGLLVEIGDVRGLADALLRYLQDPALRDAHGRAAHARVVSQFARDAVWTRWRDEYVRLLRDAQCPLPQPTVASERAHS